MTKSTQHTKALTTTPLKPLQSAFIKQYTDANSATFGNSYQSALVAGYSDQTARNFMNLSRDWLSENIRQMAVTAISADELMATLTRIIHDDRDRPSYDLKALS